MKNATHYFYFFENKEFEKSLALYEKYSKANLLTKPDYINFVKLYVQAGEHDKAKNLGDALVKFDPTLKDQVDSILNQQ